MNQAFDSSQFFRASSTAMAVLADGNVSELNHAWQRLLADPSAARGQAFTTLLERGATEHASQLLAGIGDAPVRFDARLRSELSREASVLHFEASRGESGHVLVVATVATKELDATLTQQAATVRVFSRALDGAPLILWAMNRDAICTLSQGKGLARLGAKSGDMVGANLFDLYKDLPQVTEPVMRALGGEEMQTSVAIGPLHFENWYLPLRTTDGALDGCIGLSIDVTDRVNVERELRDKLELIERQSDTIRALATPIIRVWDDVLCVPVIGTLDSARTADMMDSLLTAIVREQARFAVVDLTGVEIVDTQTADHVLHIFRAAKVLGVEGVLCGIRPAVAQTIVTLGLDLRGIHTMRTLRDALRWCIGRAQDDLAFDTSDERGADDGSESRSE